MSKFRNFYCENKLYFIIAEAILRVAIGFTSQNWAFLFNIQRWLILLSGCTIIVKEEENNKLEYNNIADISLRNS